jgi:hypothetical protein
MSNWTSFNFYYSSDPEYSETDKEFFDISWYFSMFDNAQRSAQMPYHTARM